MADRPDKAREYLDFLVEDRHEREQLEKEVLAFIVRAGVSKGFQFEIEDLQRLIKPAKPVYFMWHNDDDPR